MVKFKDFSRPCSDSPILFKADLVFKDFSRKPSIFKFSINSVDIQKTVKIKDFQSLVLFSSTFQGSFSFQGLFKKFKLSIFMPVQTLNMDSSCRYQLI